MTTRTTRGFTTPPLARTYAPRKSVKIKIKNKQQKTAQPNQQSTPSISQQSRSDREAHEPAPPKVLKQPLHYLNHRNMKHKQNSAQAQRGSTASLAVLPAAPHPETAKPITINRLLQWRKGYRNIRETNATKVFGGPDQLRLAIGAHPILTDFPERAGHINILPCRIRLNGNG